MDGDGGGGDDCAGGVEDGAGDGAIGGRLCAGLAEAEQQKTEDREPAGKQVAHRVTLQGKTSLVALGLNRVLHFAA